MKEKIFLVLVGAIFIGLGTYNLVLPVAAISIFKITLVEVSSINEIRANYGGMHLLLGLFFLYGALANRFRDAALLVVAVFTGGLVLGRLVSLMLDGSPNEAIWALLIVESVGCVVAALLFLRKVGSSGDGA
jgi:hypothetical protein